MTENYKFHFQKDALQETSPFGESKTVFVHRAHKQRNNNYDNGKWSEK
jgi:hypothetical protein